MSSPLQGDGFAPQDDGAPPTGNNANNDRTSLTKLLSKAIGMDITSIALPVSFNEPTSFLQRILEMQEDYHLLNMADRLSVNFPELALLYVTAFAVSMFAGTERTSKSFNPLLGETFEYSFTDGTKFYAEQVSHHPPIAATELENEHFKLEQWHQVKTKFLGNSLEIPPTGKTDMTLKSSGRRYRFTGCATLVQNVIIGRMWVDHYGEMEVIEDGSKRYSKLKFTKCGWFSKGWHEVKGHSYNEEGKEEFLLNAMWNKNFYATQLSGSHKGMGVKKAEKNVAKMLKKNSKMEKKHAKTVKKHVKKGGNADDLNHLSPPSSASSSRSNISATSKTSNSEEDEESDIEEVIVPEFEEGVPVNLWSKTVVETKKLPYSKWGLTDFTVDTCKLTDELAVSLPASDSRFRKDRAALEIGDTKAAGNHKHEMEEAQRARARHRATSGIIYHPRHFKLITDDQGDEHWTSMNNYWTRKEGEELLKLIDRPKRTPKAKEEKEEKKEKKKEEKEGKD
eukprot:TRINITY_DN1987_c0_g1_i1.p1 TRINITY_DN1987_c0_g1~~TRINITY_DN1987_c0_g1_i1.p1  ORF type:complete len:526 (+),score=175.89 TRINITY_DN1987_c0_g1_i1:55-1578(+)